MEPFSFLTPPKGLAALQAGFTLIEMLVVLAIIVVITSIALAGQSGFNRTLALNNATYDVGLSIELAQSKGLSSQATGANPSNTGYGVSFTPSSAQYALFVDSYPSVGSATVCHPAANASAPDARPGDCVYESGQHELVQQYSLNNGFTIGKMCARPASGPDVCSDSTLNALAVTFARPNSETFVYGQVNHQNTPWTKFISACITVVAPSGEERYLNISQTGLVSIATSCS